MHTNARVVCLLTKRYEYEKWSEITCILALSLLLLPSWVPFRMWYLTVRFAFIPTNFCFIFVFTAALSG